MATVIASSTMEDGKISADKFKVLISCTLSNSMDKVEKVLPELQKEAGVELQDNCPFEIGAKLFCLIGFFL